ncbi:hypothetical protein C8F01DRAFT_1353615 [Mycena amicta]|nr:hypothetical protein C8F01DRAFT_1353615 [Mycena amicta]
MACVVSFKERQQRKTQLHSQIDGAYAAQEIEYPSEVDFPSNLVPPMVQPLVQEAVDHRMADFEATARQLAEQAIEERGPATTEEEVRTRLDEEFQRILWEALEEESRPTEEDDEDLEQEEPADDEPETLFDDDVAFFPYPNKTALLLDVVDNLGRCQFTSAQMGLVLHLLKHLGARNVPSLKGLRKIQKRVHEDFGNKPVKITSTLGNIFYTNNIRQAIARDFGNPLLAPHLHLYPEEVVKGPVSERWQAERALDYTADQLTPMFTDGQRRWWINEVAQLKTGQFVIPKTWITRQGKLTSDAYVVTRVAGDSWDCDGQEIEIASEELESNFDDIVAKYRPDLLWTERSRQFIPGDRDMYVVGVSIWIDDQYNKFLVMLGQNTSLPGKLLKQEFHMHFMAASQNATTADTETTPIICFNAHTKREAALVLRVVDKDCDNPQQSEEASHMISASACFPCRKCKWGGRTTSVMNVGVARSVEEIRADLEKQLRMATKGNATAIEKEQKDTGTKDKLTQYWIERVLARVQSMVAEDPRRSKDDIAEEAWKWLQDQAGDKMNPLLDVTGLDPARDTPVEILHTILLGVIKYVWHHLHTNQWSDADRQLLAIQLQSTDIGSMKIPPVRGAYMIQYKNNLIGKHYKTIMQTLAFHVHDICTPEQLQLIKVSADLGARVWVPVIDDMEKYIEELKVAVANVLDAWDAVDPLRVLVKIKLHLLVHLPDDVKRFGPPVRFSTETQEGYNAVFRMCSINSNKQAPSRDIAMKFSAMNSVKHALCGGYWWSASGNEWTQPSVEVKRLVLDDPVFQRHLGWVSSSTPKPGFVRACALEKHCALPWQETRAAQHLSGPDRPSMESLWKRGQYVVTKSGDHVKDLTWVFVRDAKGVLVLGRVSEIVVSKEMSFVMLERFICTQKRHPTLDWPVIRRPSGAEITTQNITSYLVVKGSDIEFACSIQHDCIRGSCRPSVVGKQRQEREETTHNISLIKHDDDEHFVLNMGSTHNFADLISVAVKAKSTCTAAREKTAQRRRETTAAKKKRAEDELEAASLEAEKAEMGAEDSVDEEDEEMVNSDKEQEPEEEEELTPARERESDDDYIPVTVGTKRQRSARSRGRSGGSKRART